MPDTAAPYPAHIYEPKRLQLAIMIIQKELHKLLLGLDATAWDAVHASIAGWIHHPEAYHLEADGPRDFWDVFAGITESIKLKPNFTAWVTAQNVTWQTATMPVDTIQMTSGLEQLHAIPGLRVRNDLPITELQRVLQEHPEALGQQQRLIDAHSTDPQQDGYPIIVRQTTPGQYKVMDGNRRTLQAVLYGRPTINAWVGVVTGSDIKNFWVPINDMTQLVKVYKHAAESSDQSLQHAVAMVLKARFAASSVAEQAYRQRIGNQSAIAQELYDLTHQLPD